MASMPGFEHIRLKVRRPGSRQFAIHYLMLGIIGVGGSSRSLGRRVVVVRRNGLLSNHCLVYVETPRYDRELAAGNASFELKMLKVISIAETTSLEDYRSR
jgi:hypothetical protein